jgi:hypothetical protein
LQTAVWADALRRQKTPRNDKKFWFQKDRAKNRGPWNHVDGQTDKLKNANTKTEQPGRS